MKVSVEDTLLSKYSDKELIKYAADSLEVAFKGQVPEEISTEAKLAVRLAEAECILDLLKAISKRMNGNSQNTNIMI